MKEETNKELIFDAYNNIVYFDNEFNCWKFAFSILCEK